ncbi:hypothetical protein D9754_11125 [Planomicrobium sp. Y74]|nr:hypothetical protein D9754_11125 [Planomicrobium sp. Y74]
MDSRLVPPFLIRNRKHTGYKFLFQGVLSKLGVKVEKLGVFRPKLGVNRWKLGVFRPKLGINERSVLSQKKLASS